MENNNVKVDLRPQLEAIYKAIDDKKGENIKVLDISNLSPLADYFVIATSDNKNQMRAIRDNIEEAMMKYKNYAKSIEGDNDSAWLLMDFKDIVVHVFDRESRSFYDLERIWNDAEEINL